MTEKKPKTVTAEARNGEELAVTLVTGETPGLLVFVPGDFSKPESLEETESSKMIMVVITENWLNFKGFLKDWDLVGGIHFGYSKPRKKRR